MKVIFNEFYLPSNWRYVPHWIFSYDKQEYLSGGFCHFQLTRYHMLTILGFCFDIVTKKGFMP